MFNDIEELILFIIAFAGLLNGYIWGCLSLVRQYLEWRIECKQFLLSACDNTCMCGSPINYVIGCDNHQPMSQYDWALNNMPKLRFK